MGAKATAHEILADLSRVQRELGRVPSRPEYGNHGRFPGTVVTEVFGSYALMLKMSGLEYAARGRRDKQEIRRQVFEAVKKEAEDRRVIKPPPIANNLLIIPDLHAPYHHPDAIDFLYELNSKYNFDSVSCTGDEIDAHALSFHDHDPDLLSPGHELEAAIKALEPLYKMFAVMDLAESNHGSLVYRRGKHFGLPRHVLKSYSDVLQSPPGWKWHFEINQQLSNGQRILIHHSYSVSVLNSAKQRGCNMAFGHHHQRFSIEYWETYDGLHFAIFASSLADANALAAEYGKNNPNRPICGAVRITGGVPHLEPMLKDKYGRWTGKLAP